MATRNGLDQIEQKIDRLIALVEDLSEKLEDGIAGSEGFEKGFRESMDSIFSFEVGQ